MVGKVEIATLKDAASARGTSLNRYVAGVLHEQARREHHRKLFAAVAAQEPDLPPFDSVGEVRAMRDEKDVNDNVSSGQP